MIEMLQTAKILLEWRPQLTAVKKNSGDTAGKNVPFSADR